MSKSINRQDLISAVAELADLPKPKAAEAVDAVYAEMQQALRRRVAVRLPGFGNFTLGVRKATKGRNLRTGEVIAIPASTSIRFEPGKGLKDAVSSGE